MKVLATRTDNDATTAPEEYGMRFTDKVVLVTGSTKGIGAQIARRFAAEGASVVVTGRSKDLGEGVVTEIRQAGGAAEFVAGDISVESDVTRVVSTAVDRFGALHVLVNNAAGVDVLGDELKITDESIAAFEQQVRTGLYGAVFATRAAIPAMLATGRGAIVNISSIAGVQSVEGLPAYSCVKGALQAFSRQIAGDYGKQGIRSNCIITGAIFHTDSIASAVIGHPLVRAALAEVLLTKDGEMGAPDDIAEAALYLASDGARLVNGVQLPVDGGLTCRSSLPDISRVLADAAAGEV
jgi:NAD(P)-dependent dehydrogenase (short-subunit alcohol dehydrogenase family)